MQDIAAELMAGGRQVAVARVQGVDDNMDRPHRHEFLEAYVLEAGQRDHWSGGQVHRITTPDIITFPPHDEHFSYSPPGVPFRRVVVYGLPEAVLLEDVRRRALAQVRVCRPGAADASTVSLIVRRMIQLQEGLGDRAQDEMGLLLTQLLVVLQRQQEIDAIAAEREARAAAIIRHLHEHYTEHIELEDLAEIFYVSRFHLAREFRRHTGTTVISYVNALRVDQARRLLQETERPIGEISAQVGFRNVTHFNRVFRDRTGITPREERRARPVHRPG
ncbi:helix-turn-helix transcriptional regulator [Brachybacterium hainanense]|uniref:AraC family transcriptional regulator n=1 Tax=Brachybacterium hainanense TaxID=1541174 RepID=A0ABV6R8T1_9MICO